VDGVRDARSGQFAMTFTRRPSDWERYSDGALESPGVLAFRRKTPAGDGPTRRSGGTFSPRWNAWRRCSDRS